MKRAKKLMDILIRPRLAIVLLHLGVTASVEHTKALHDLKSKTVVDIGANRGQFSLLARELFPEARIIAFEPLPGPAATFQRVFANDSRVRVHNIAIGPESTHTTIHVSARDDSSSLLPITETQSRIFPGTQETGTTAVEVRRLDEVLKPDEITAPALLKLDVQGYELEALRGCEALLQNFAYVYAECSFMELYKGQALADEVIAWLRERGFALSGVYNMAYDKSGKAVQADFLFQRRSAACAS